MFISFCLLRRIDMGFIKMICNTMSHWVPIKYISEKYQIDENYICNLNGKLLLRPKLGER